MNNKIFNIVAVLNETFKEIDIDFDDHMEVMNSIGFLHLFDDLKDYHIIFYNNIFYNNIFYDEFNIFVIIKSVF